MADMEKPDGEAAVHVSRVLVPAEEFLRRRKKTVVPVLKEKSPKPQGEEPSEFTNRLMIYIMGLATVHDMLADTVILQQRLMRAHMSRETAEQCMSITEPLLAIHSMAASELKSLK